MRLSTLMTRGLAAIALRDTATRPEPVRAKISWMGNSRRSSKNLLDPTHSPRREPQPKGVSQRSPSPYARSLVTGPASDREPAPDGAPDGGAWVLLPAIDDETGGRDHVTLVSVCKLPADGGTGKP